MKLDYRIRELIAVGTSVGTNCHSCLEYHFGKAREQRVPDDEITETICDRPKSVHSPGRVRVRSVWVARTEVRARDWPEGADELAFHLFAKASMRQTKAGDSGGSGGCG
jgi:AhpD family alkylhydroperoxidase